MNVKTLATRAMGGGLLAASLLLSTIQPAGAASLGAGVASGSEDQIDVADPATNGTIDVVGPAPTFGPLGVCARVQDGEYIDPDTGLPDGDGVSAQYTLNAVAGALTTSGGTYTGPVSMVVKSGASFYFGPQGTHYGPSLLGGNCGASNLGQLSPVPASVTISGTGFSCEAPGSFWREGADAFGASVTFTGGPCGPSTVDFVGVYQPPCGLPVPCINGAYVQR